MNINTKSLIEEEKYFMEGDTQDWGRKRDSRGEGTRRRDVVRLPCTPTFHFTVWTLETYVLHVQNAIKSKGKKRKAMPKNWKQTEINEPNHVSSQWQSHTQQRITSNPLERGILTVYISWNTV